MAEESPNAAKRLRENELIDSPNRPSAQAPRWPPVASARTSSPRRRSALRRRSLPACLTLRAALSGQRIGASTRAKRDGGTGPLGGVQ
jgi:hypothetical protein